MISASSLKRAVKSKKVLIDSNIIIYLTDMVQPYAALAQRLFQMIEAGDAEAVISILSISEVMHGPLRKGDGRIAMEARDFLYNFPNSYCQDITYEVLEKVGHDGRVDWKKLRTADSLIIASGLLNEVDLFISNDEHFKKSISPGMLLAFH